IGAVDCRDGGDVSLQDRGDADPRGLFGRRGRPLPDRRGRTMRTPFAVLVATVLGGMLMTGISAAETPATRIDIAAMPAGAPPPGFAVARTGNGAAAEWRVVDDPTATAGKAIAPTKQDTTD